jgi:hypothetical protein
MARETPSCLETVLTHLLSMRAMGAPTLYRPVSEDRRQKG